MTNLEIIKKFKEVGLKYNFPIVDSVYHIVLAAKNTDNKQVDWIVYNIATDTVSCRGNTDQLNLWLCNTRKDFTVEKTIQFIKDLNISLDLHDQEGFLISDLIDPEDWQEIANVHDAYGDERYNQL